MATKLDRTDLFSLEDYAQKRADFRAISDRTTVEIDEIGLWNTDVVAKRYAIRDHGYLSLCLWGDAPLPIPGSSSFLIASSVSRAAVRSI